MLEPGTKRAPSQEQPERAPAATQASVLERAELVDGRRGDRITPFVGTALLTLSVLILLRPGLPIFAG